MTRRCILQIGTEKTGTTTLQMFLARNRDRLAHRGVRYPRFPGDVNHTGLAAYAMDDERQDSIRGALGVHGPADVPRYRARQQAAARAELGTPGTVILCNEHCHSRLTTEREVRRLRDLLAPHFDRIDVCVYLRRQDQLALSLYSTRLKSGGTDTDILPRTDESDPFFNYDISLALWESAFGHDRVHVRLFEKDLLVGGDIVADFLAAWDLGPPEEYRSVGRMNESISAVAQDYLRRVNAHVKPVTGLPLSGVLGPLSNALARHFGGKGARPSRAAAVAFHEMFRASNEALRARHFPERAALFSEDFHGYPEDADPMSFGADDVAAVAARLHTAHTREILRLEAEIRIRDGKLAWERGDPDAAVAALRSATSILPDHPESQRALAEFLYRAGRPEDAVAPARTAVALRPERAEYWHFLGVVLRSAGDLKGAATAQERCLELEGGHEPSRNALDSIRAEIAQAEAVG